MITEQNSFLSAYSLDNYHSMEGNFTQALIAFTKKQFFQVSNVVSLMHKFISCYLNPAPKDNYLNFTDISAVLIHASDVFSN